MLFPLLGWPILSYYKADLLTVTDFATVSLNRLDIRPIFGLSSFIGLNYVTDF